MRHFYLGKQWVLVCYRTGLGGSTNEFAMLDADYEKTEIVKNYPDITDKLKGRRTQLFCRNSF